MEQERIDALKRLVDSRSDPAQGIEEIQIFLKSQGLYIGKIESDMDNTASAGLMAAFRQHPALLNNAAPWLIKSMEENGFGTQLRQLVASNPDLRAHLVASALELVDTPPRAHNELHDLTKTFSTTTTKTTSPPLSATTAPVTTPAPVVVTSNVEDFLAPTEVLASSSIFRDVGEELVSRGPTTDIALSGGSYVPRPVQRYGMGMMA